MKIEPVIPQSLIELAERKLGKGVTVQVRGGEWRASQIVKRGEHTGVRTVAASTRDNLFWFLEQLEDAPKMG